MTGKKDLAITVYVDNNDIQIEYFSWLYKSFIYSGNYINSDIVLFYNPLIINKLDHHIIEDKNVIKVELNPIDKIDPIWSFYSFINSMYYLTTQEAEFLKEYQYILRTDCDVFLTKNLINYRPDTWVFGMGRYVKTIEVRDKIVDIINRLKLEYRFVHNVGSSLLFHSGDVMDFNKYQYDICRYLRLNDFKDYIGEWPG